MFTVLLVFPIQFLLVGFLPKPWKIPPLPTVYQVCLFTGVWTWTILIHNSYLYIWHSNLFPLWWHFKLLGVCFDFQIDYNIFFFLNCKLLEGSRHKLNFFKCSTVLSTLSCLNRGKGSWAGLRPLQDTFFFPVVLTSLFILTCYKIWGYRVYLYSHFDATLHLWAKWKCLKSYLLFFEIVFSTCFFVLGD